LFGPLPFSCGPRRHSSRLIHINAPAVKMRSKN
jgi:hypothetical protein